MGIAFCTGAVESFDQPVRQSLYPHVIDRQVMGSAAALNSCIWQGTRIIMASALANPHLPHLLIKASSREHI